MKSYPEALDLWGIDRLTEAPMYDAPTPAHRAKVMAWLKAWRAEQIARGGRLEGGYWVYPEAPKGSES